MDDIYTKKPEECAYSFTQHTACEFFPCHKTSHPEDFNCLFCYCPLYTLGSKCGGNFRYLENGVKDCSDCLLPHGRGSYSPSSQVPGTHGAGQEKPIRKETASRRLFFHHYSSRSSWSPLVAEIVDLIASGCPVCPLVGSVRSPRQYRTYRASLHLHGGAVQKLNLLDRAFSCRSSPMSCTLRW